MRKVWGRQRAGGLLAALVLLSLVGVACSKKRPPSLPVTTIYARATSKIEVVKIVVQDPVRAERASALYLKQAREAEDALTRRAMASQHLVEATMGPELDEEAILAEMEQLKVDGRHSFKRYIDLQLELRETLTESEFEALKEFE